MPELSILKTSAAIVVTVAFLVLDWFLRGQALDWSYNRFSLSGSHIAYTLRRQHPAWRPASSPARAVRPPVQQEVVFQETDINDVRLKPSSLTVSPHSDTKLHFLSDLSYKNSFHHSN